MQAKTKITLACTAIAIGISASLLFQDDHDRIATDATNESPLIAKFSKIEPGKQASHTQQNLSTDSSVNATANNATDETFIEQTVALMSTADYQANSQFGELPAHMRNVALLPLQFDEHGNFIATDNFTGLIEHFLMAAEDEGYDQALARLQEYLALVLPADANDQARELLDQYLLYKERVVEEIQVNENEQNLTILASQIEQMVQKKKDIRREVMSPEIVEALFAREEALDDFNVTTMNLNLDQSLSYEEKDQRIAAAEKLLPIEIQEKKRYSREKKNLKREISALKQKGDKAEEIYALRKAFYGQETADRITYFEDFSPEWVQRVEQFRSQQAYILQQNDLSQEESAQQVAYLKNSLFSEKEQMKLAVYNIKARAGLVN